MAVQFCLLGQTKNSQSKNVNKAGKIYTNKKLTGYSENDKNGNLIFSKNDGMNGEITMLFAAEYDSLNRKTRIFLAHSNIGFSLSEKVYDSNKIYHYEYKNKADTVDSFDRDTLNKINTRLEFLELHAIKALIKGKRQLNEIEILDAAKNVIAEIYFSENGDTSSINTHTYNSNNKEILFRYGLKSEEPWIWDIYYLYDSSLNLIKSIRLSSKHGKMDTTEVYTNHYNSSNLMISKDYYNAKKFMNKTDYTYNTKKQLIKEYFFEREESILDVITYYLYNSNGKCYKKIQIDYRLPKKDRKKVLTY
jgi:hypothetical protein